MPSNNLVTLKVYNMLGEEVARLVDGMQNAGYKSVRLDANKLPSGIYLCNLNAGTFFDVKRLVLIR